MKNMMFSDIVKFLGEEEQWKGEDFPITGISKDTRTISRGEIYCAINGDNHDGAEYADMAESKGASAIIAERPLNVSIPVIVVENTIKAMHTIANCYRRCFDIPVIAITGSNGKTTTREMIHTILTTKYKVLATENNLNNHIGLPMMIYRLDDSHEVVVLEMGMNHLGEIDVLTKIAEPDVAIITNVGKAHIGNLGSQENIKKAKFEIVNGLRDNGTLILNGEDKYLAGHSSDRYSVEYVGSCEGTCLSAKSVENDGTKISFTVCRGDEECECRLNIPGVHNVYNALEAINCSLRFGITLADACAALSNYQPVSMRNEISVDKGVTIYKDYYNASPDSMRAAINNLVSGKGKRKIGIFGQMLELGEYSADEHRILAERCNKAGLDQVFFIGSDYKAFLEGIGDTPCFAYSEKERREFLEKLLEFVRDGGIAPGDDVLMKGSRGVKMEEIYEQLKAYINSVTSDFTTLPPSPTRLYVDVNAMKHNFFQIAASLEKGVEIMPMVKANAYGCGVDIIANVFKDCKYLAVADVKEAAMIKRILPNASIMIIYQPIIADVEEIVKGGYVSAVGDLNFARALDEESAKAGVKSKIHIEVDTGAARLGISVKDAASFAEEIKKLENLEFDGIFMHYVCADSFTESDLEFTKLQSTRFAEAVGAIEGVLGTANHKHACAGAAIFNKNAVHYNMVRPGYMLYGYYPSPELRQFVDLKPALKFVAVILKITEHEAGTPVSYNRRYTTSRRTKIATVSAGYSDGLFRSLFKPNSEKSGCFVVNGQKAPIVGSICMDLTMIDITDIEGEVKVGDEVAIFDNVNVTLDDMADICGTIGYEIIARIEDKADRVEQFR